MSVDVKFRTSATATADKIRTEDGRLDIPLAAPTELGGSSDGTNPEQLFAAGYSACFFSSLKLAAQRAKIHLPADASVSAAIGLGPRSEGGWGLEASLSVKLPGLDPKETEQLIGAAHQSALTPTQLATMLQSASTWSRAAALRCSSRDHLVHIPSH